MNCEFSGKNRGLILEARVGMVIALTNRPIGAINSLNSEYEQDASMDYT